MYKSQKSWMYRLDYPLFLIPIRMYIQMTFLCWPPHDEGECGIVNGAIVSYRCIISLDYYVYECLAVKLYLML